MSRSLAACQGTILLVDSSQGIQAQTVANFFLAFNEGLTVIPVINKVRTQSFFLIIRCIQTNLFNLQIDLPTAEPDRVVNQIESTFELDVSNIALV